MATRRRNKVHAGQVGIGRWIKASAVRFNRDGSTSVKRSGARRRNVAAGWVEEETGIFHPIRASYDYSRSRAGERPLKKAKKRRKKATAKKRRR